MDIGEIPKQEFSFATVGGASSPDNRGWKPLPQTVIVPRLNMTQLGIPKYFRKIPNQRVSLCGQY
jgi:hypothetical protein